MDFVWIGCIKADFFPIASAVALTKSAAVRLQKRIAELEHELEKAKNKPPQIVEKIVEKIVTVRCRAVAGLGLQYETTFKHDSALTSVRAGGRTAACSASRRADGEVEADNSELERLRKENEELKEERKRLKATIKDLEQSGSEHLVLY